jgi:protein involved in polysaccharide export with SLBB domain
MTMGMTGTMMVKSALPTWAVRVFSLTFAALMCLSAPALADVYKLDIQDRLRIYVTEWPALTGEFSVGANGSVSLPIIGETRARGLEPSELAGAIADSLKTKANLRQQPDVSIDVVGYRPFYILGAVTTPGEYPYRPEMVVLNALSISGGLYRAQGLSEWDLARTSIASTGELNIAEMRRSTLIAEQIRFEAEVGKRAFPDTPPGTSPALANAIEEQRQLYNAQKLSDENQNRTLASVIELHEAQIQSIGQQLEGISLKLQSFQAELATAKKLEAQGLSVNKRLPLERDVFDIEREESQLQFEKVRAERTIQESKLRMSELMSQRQSDALSGLQRVTSQMREIDEQSFTLNKIVNGVSMQSEQLEQSKASQTAPKLRFTIVRGRDKDLKEFLATETTPVLPGDIIKVDFEGRKST